MGKQDNDEDDNDISTTNTDRKLEELKEFLSAQNVVIEKLKKVVTDAK